MKKKKFIVLLIILALILLDQFSKIMVSKHLLSHDLTIITNFLKFTYVKNFGAAFGILQGKRLLFLLITLIALSYLIHELIKSKNKLYNVSLILIISGILGNFIDRLLFGYVRDFISFSIFYPVFNIADSLIVVGVIIFVICMFVGDKK